MNALRFAHPEWLAVLSLTWLALALLMIAVGERARRRRRRLLGAGGRLATRGLRSDAALVLACGALALAALGPRIGERVLKIPATGVDVVIAIDVSRSMEARDVPPSRLERALRAAAGVLERLEPFDRVGLAAFGGAGVLLAPLTPDRGVIAELLTGLDTGLLVPASSDLAAGVAAALSAFEVGSTRPRIVLVLSDGEDPEHGRELGAAAAARADTRVLAVAFGSEAGATLPDHGLPLVDRSGRTVVSRRDLARLGELTRGADGELFAADDWGEVDLARVVHAIRRDVGPAPGAVVERRVRAVRVWPFAALAFVLLLLEGLPRPLARRSRPGPGWRQGASVAALVLGLLGAVPSPAGESDATLPVLEEEVRTRPHDPSGLIALGAARLEHGQGRAAARAFLAAAVRARTSREAEIAYYDLGVAALELGDLEQARGAFLDALALTPDDAQARFNLEWTLLAQRQSQPVPTAQPGLPEPLSETPPPGPPPEPERAPRETLPEPAPLSDAEQRRWLERIEDDPGRALRSAAAASSGSERAVGPVW